MGNGPAPFSKISKRVKDILTKGYCGCGKEMSLSVYGSTPMELINGLGPGRIFFRESAVSTSLSFDEVLPHTKAVVSFEVPDPTSGKLDVKYRHRRVSIDASIGLNRSPTVSLNAECPYKDVELFGLVGFDFSSASFTNYTAGISKSPVFLALYNQQDRGKSLGAGYSHLINRSNQITAVFTHHFPSSGNTMRLESEYVIRRFHRVKTKFSSNGKVSMSYEREWRPNSLKLTVSADYNIRRAEVSPKWGLAIALNL